MEIIDETVYSVKPENIKARPIRTKRCKKKIINAHPLTITRKLFKLNTCSYTLSLYGKDWDKHFFFCPEERNCH